MWKRPAAHIAASNPPSRPGAARRRGSRLGRFGYAEVRVEDVCVAAGMAKGSFYRWFESKGDAT